MTQNTRTQPLPGSCEWWSKYPRKMQLSLHIHVHVVSFIPMLQRMVKILWDTEFPWFHVTQSPRQQLQPVVELGINFSLVISAPISSPAVDSCWQDRGLSKQCHRDQAAAGTRLISEGQSRETRGKTARSLKSRAGKEPSRSSKYNFGVGQDS